MARRRFTAQSVSRGSGLLAKTHQARMRNGRMMEVSAKRGHAGNTQRDPELGDAKRRILNRLPMQEAQVRQVMRQGIARAREIYKEADRSARRSGGELRVVEKERLRGSVTNIVVDSVTQMRNQVLTNIESSVKTYLIGVRRTLPDRSQLSMSQIRELSRRVAVEIYNQPAGRDGVTTAQRLSALGVKMEAELLRNLDAKDRDYERLGRALVDPKGANKSCVSRGVARINRTEQSRALHEATLRAGKVLGVKLYYWRLSAAHKSYGGTEICEVLSVSTGLDVLTEMPDSFTGSREGLYTESSVPTLPHPNCMCSIEPVIL